MKETFEQTYVNDFYDVVADHFSMTRRTLWLKVMLKISLLLNKGF